MSEFGQKRSFALCLYSRAGKTCNVEHSHQPMRSVEVVTRRKGQVAVVLALAATCILGRMTFVAATSAFENPAPTTFQQLAGLWDVLRWSVPAMLIGTMVTRRVMTVAAAVSLISGLILLAFEYSSFVPTGEHFPDSMYFGGVAIELGTGVAIAALAAMVAKTACRWIVSRLYQRKKTQSS